ncbi:fiber [Bovine adenovirus 7]|nr:fiber [Bovine adenovirus 7]
MKRARLDPVYPFSEEKLIPLPPFIRAGTGLESEGLILSLNYTDPIGLTPTGALTIKVGPGISVVDGKITATEMSSLRAPLARINQTLELQTNQTLTLKNDHLSITDPLFPLSIDSDGHLILTLTNPLYVNNNTLALKLSSPLYVDAENSLSLKYSFPFYENENMLQLSINEPLFLNESGKLALQSNAPFGVTGGKLSLNLSSPFQIKNGNLNMGIEQPLIVNAEGNLSINTTLPITNIGSSLMLKTTDPFDLDNSGNLSLKVNEPLNVNNALELGYMPPLQTENGKLSVQITNPLTVTDDKLSISLGKGLTTSNNSLTLYIGNGLEFSQGMLSVKLASSLGFSPTGAISTVSKQGSQLITLLSVDTFSIGWQIIPTLVGMIRILTGTQFLPTSPISSFTITAGSDLQNFYAMDTPFITHVTQIVENTVRLIGLTISKEGNNSIKFQFTSPLTENVYVSTFTAHQYSMI